MLICIVNSEEEYLDLIADLSKYGVHELNQFAEPDENGMALSDSFNRLPPHIAEEYLGVRDYKWEVTTEVGDDGREWEVEPSAGEGPLKRETLHFCPELQNYVTTPKPEDFPILIMWEWGDDHDRCGPVKTRYFDWIGMSRIPNSHQDGSTIVKKKFDLWWKNFGDRFKEYLEAERKMRNRRNSKVCSTCKYFYNFGICGIDCMPSSNMCSRYVEKEK
jgi:hypothetical protein